MSDQASSTAPVQNRCWLNTFASDIRCSGRSVPLRDQASRISGSSSDHRRAAESAPIACCSRPARRGTSSTRRRARPSAARKSVAARPISPALCAPSAPSASTASAASGWPAAGHTGAQLRVFRASCHCSAAWSSRAVRDRASRGSRGLCPPVPSECPPHTRQQRHHHPCRPGRRRRCGGGEHSDTASAPARPAGRRSPWAAPFSASAVAQLGQVIRFARGLSLRNLAKVIAIVPLALVLLYAPFQTGQQVTGGLDSNATVNAWGGPTYAEP